MCFRLGVNEIFAFLSCYAAYISSFRRFWGCPETSMATSLRCVTRRKSEDHRRVILIYIQQYATLHSLFYLETALHVSGGTSTPHQERKQLRYCCFWLPAAAMAQPSQRLGTKNLCKTRGCSYSF